MVQSKKKVGAGKNKKMVEAGKRAWATRCRNKSLRELEVAYSEATSAGVKSGIKKKMNKLLSE